MVKKKIIDFSVTYDFERIFKVVCFLFPEWFLSQFMAIVGVLNELVFSLFYKANVMQQCQWSYFWAICCCFFLSTLTYV